MIVKVQLALFSTEQNPKALVYDRERTFDQQIELSADVIERMRERPKVFFSVTVMSDALLFGDEVEDPGW